MRILQAIYVAGIPLTIYLAGGMFFSELRSVGKKQPVRLGEIFSALIMGFFYSLLWPILLPLAFVLTNGAENGVWKK